MCIHTHTFAVIIIQIFNNQHDRHESIGMDANSIYWLSEYQYKKKIFVVKKKSDWNPLVYGMQLKAFGGGGWEVVGTCFWGPFLRHCPWLEEHNLDTFLPLGEEQSPCVVETCVSAHRHPFPSQPPSPCLWEPALPRLHEVLPVNSSRVLYNGCWREGLGALYTFAHPLPLSRGAASLPETERLRSPQRLTLRRRHLTSASVSLDPWGQPHTAIGPTLFLWFLFLKQVS